MYSLETFPSFYIYWMTFIWNKGLGELEKSKSQNKDGNGKINQKEWNSSVNCPWKTKMVILNQSL